MAGCNVLGSRICGVLAAIGCLLPQIALSDGGACPPYSRTFGTDDPADQIVAYLGEINQRPDGGTLVLEPGFYDLPYPVIPVSGIVCIRAAGEGAGKPIVQLIPEIEPGGILTVESVQIDFIVGRFSAGTMTIAAGATLFANDTTISGYVRNDGAAYLNDATVTGHGLRNRGWLIMTGGSIEFVYQEGSIGLWNSSGGYAFLERVSVNSNFFDYDFSADGTGIANAGVLSLVDSVVFNNGAYAQEPLVPGELPDCRGVGLFNSGSAYVVGSTIAHNLVAYDPTFERCGFGIRNEGYVEVSRSIVADNGEADCAGAGILSDLGHNVFGVGGGCVVSDPTSIEADPLFEAWVELSAASPAIDRVPLELCAPTDYRGRERVDGDGDGVVGCDAGALEYALPAVAAKVRARPWWRKSGEVDLAADRRLRLYVISTETFDATTVVPGSIEIEGLERSARRGPRLVDINRDGREDIRLWYRLDRMAPLSCGYQDRGFTAVTGDGRQVTGRVRFNAIGCQP